MAPSGAEEAAKEPRNRLLCRLSAREAPLLSRVQTPTFNDFAHRLSLRTLGRPKQRSALQSYLKSLPCNMAQARRRAARGRKATRSCMAGCAQRALEVQHKSTYRSRKTTAYISCNRATRGRRTTPLAPPTCEPPSRSSFRQCPCLTSCGGASSSSHSCLWHEPRMGCKLI